MGTWEHRAILEGNKGTRTPPPWETLKPRQRKVFGLDILLVVDLPTLLTLILVEVKMTWQSHLELPARQHAVVGDD